MALVEAERGDDRLDLLTEGGFRRIAGLPLQARLPRLHAPACRSGSWSTDFAPGRSFRRVLRRNAELALGRDAGARAPTSSSPCSSATCAARHHDGGMVRMDREAYREMVEVAPASTRLVEFRDPAGTLVGVSLTDRLRSGLSGVYKFYAPELEQHSLGTYIILWHIERAQRARPALRLSRLLDRRRAARWPTRPLRAARAPRRCRLAAVRARTIGRRGMSDTFRALLLEQEDGRTTARLAELPVDDLPEGEVLVDVAYSTLNYKDALAITGAGKIVRQFPFVPGIDLAGTVADSSRSALQARRRGRAYRLGRRRAPLGRARHQGAAQGRLAAAPSRGPLAGGERWRSAPPASPPCSACWRWRSRASRPSAARSWSPVPRAVSAASRSRSSPAPASRWWPSSGRAELAGYLKELGAAEVVGPRAVSPGLEGAARLRPLGRCRGQRRRRQVLANLLKAMRPGGAVAACGLAAGPELETTVFPFILRGVRLIGINSVAAPGRAPPRGLGSASPATSTAACWTADSRTVTLDEVPAIAPAFLKGAMQGRVVVRTGG